MMPCFVHATTEAVLLDQQTLKDISLALMILMRFFHGILRRQWFHKCQATNTQSGASTLKAYSSIFTCSLPASLNIIR